MMHSKPFGKRSFFLFLVLALLQMQASAQSGTDLYRMKTIVIDAGHGGKDPGNLGTGRYKTREKDIALDIALRVGDYIKKQFPELNVVYTRDTDVFIGLNERADIANKAKADLFISIHCNAFNNPNSNGTETYVLGLHRNEENLQVAMKENSAIFLEDDYKTKYEGFDPNSPESIIALTIMQSAFLQQSLSLSSYVQKQFKSRVGRRDRGVKQAGFLVLRRTTMPSILIELGFLTNAPEEDFLNSENGKAYMASAIFRGFKEYKELVEDPLPEGYVPESRFESEEVKKQEELDKKLKEAEAAKQKELEAARKDEEQKRLKAIADSLEHEKARLLEEKKKRQEEEEARAAEWLRAKADSLERIKQQKVQEMTKRQAELEAEQKRKAEEERLAKEEEIRKAEQAKEDAKEWLEEIKAEKERELQKAKEEAAIAAEKERLEAIRKEKERQLEEARNKAVTDSLEELRLRKQFADQIKHKEDSLREVRVNQSKLDALKRRQDSIAAIKKVSSDVLVLNEPPKTVREEASSNAVKAEIGDENATSPEEAELLFLQLRKKQLEERIAKLKSKNVVAPTTKDVEEQAERKSAPKNKVNSAKSSGVVLKVQVVTASERLSATDSRFRGVEVWEYQQGGLYKYTAGNTQDFEEITKLQSELRNLGFQGAFVVAFKDGERIKVSEAREILKGNE